MDLTRPFILLLAAASVSACAVRLGGSSPDEYPVIAIAAPATATSGEIADVITGARANLVLLTADRDSAWFGDVATRTGLALSGPGQTETPAKAFLSNLEILGDTSIVLGVADGSRMHMHDALYQIEEEGRLIDLMLIGVSDGSDLREAARTLLAYIATDVGANAAVVMAIDSPSRQAADSLATLLRAAYTTAGECAGDAGGTSTSTVRLYYGPSARVRCSSARQVQGIGSPMLAELIVGR
jgi:hypothetical protein